MNKKDELKEAIFAMLGKIAFSEGVSYATCATREGNLSAEAYGYKVSKDGMDIFSIVAKEPDIGRIYILNAGDKSGMYEIEFPRAKGLIMDIEGTIRAREDEKKKQQDTKVLNWLQDVLAGKHKK